MFMVVNIVIPGIKWYTPMTTDKGIGVHVFVFTSKYNIYI